MWTITGNMQNLVRNIGITIDVVKHLSVPWKWKSVLIPHTIDISIIKCTKLNHDQECVLQVMSPPLHNLFG